MKKYLFLIVLLLTPLLTTATTQFSPVSNNLTYNECLKFQDDAIATNGSGYIGQCKKATCTGSWKTDYLYANDMVRCTNGNTNEYLEVVSNGCSEYVGVCTPSALTIKYCSVVSFYDCSRTRDGSEYIKPTTTRKTTTTKRTTTTTRRIITTVKPAPTTTTTKPVTTTKKNVLDNNNYLSYLSVSAGELNFNKEVNLYTITVDKSVTVINIDTEAESPKAKVVIENAGKFKIDRPIVITVTAEDSSTRVYSINVKYKEEEVSSNNLLKNIIIENYNLKFKPTKNSYKLRVANEVESLNIYVEQEDPNATYVVVGNEKLKNNSKIKIIVTALNGEENTYTITVKKTSKILLYILLLIVLGIIGIILFRLIKRLIPVRKDAKYSYE